MRLVDKTEKWSRGNERFVGRKKNFEVNIYFSSKNYLDNNEYWYYSLNRERDNKSYNSLWNKEKFNTKEECVEAAEKKIDELIKSK